MIHSRRSCLIVGLSLLIFCLGLLLVTADRRILSLLLNSLLLSAGVCLASLPLGTLLAILLTRTDLPGRRIIWVLLLTLLLLPLYFHAAAWAAGFGKLGWYSLARLSVDEPLLRGWDAAIWIHSLWSVPWVTLIVSAVLSTCEPELEEQALLELPAWQVLGRVTLRRAVPGVAAAGVWVALITVGEMTVTDLYQIRTLAEELYSDFMLSPGDVPVFGVRSGVLVTGMLVGFALVGWDVLVVTAVHVPTRAPFRFSLGRWRVPVLVVVGGLLVTVLAPPLGSLIYQAGTEVQLVDGRPVRAWSLAQFLEILVPLPNTYRQSAIWQYAPEFRWTLLIGASAASLALSIAVPLAWWGRRGIWRVLPAASVAALGFATLGPLVGLVLIALFTYSDFSWWHWVGDRTIAAPVMAATLRVIPLPMLICLVAFRTLNRDVLDAASLDGARAWTRLWTMGVRQRWPAMLVAWLVAFALACGELSATILVSPAGITTVPIRVFGLLHAGVRNQVAGLCLTLLLGFFGIALAVAWLAPRIWRARSRSHGVVPQRSEDGRTDGRG